MNELCYDEVDTRDPFRELVRSKDAAYFEATPYFFYIRKILIEICVEKDQSGLQRGSHLWPKRGFT